MPLRRRNSLSKTWEKGPCPRSWQRPASWTCGGATRAGRTGAMEPLDYVDRHACPRAGVISQHRGVDPSRAPPGRGKSKAGAGTPVDTQQGRSLLTRAPPPPPPPPSAPPPPPRAASQARGPPTAQGTRSVRSPGAGPRAPPPPRRAASEQGGGTTGAPAWPPPGCAQSGCGWPAGASRSRDRRGVGAKEGQGGGLGQLAIPWRPHAGYVPLNPHCTSPYPTRPPHALTPGNT